MKIISNFIYGLWSVLTATEAPKLRRYHHDTLADGFRDDWQGVAKDIKRVQKKLKAEAHDGKQNKK